MFPTPSLRLPFLLSGFLTLALSLTACRAPAPLPPRSPALSPSRSPASSASITIYQNTLAAVNPHSASITLVDTPSLTILAEIPVGPDPRTLAFAPDGTLLVATRAALVFIDATRTVTSLPLTGRPYGVIADSERAYVTLADTAQLAVIDLHARAVTRLLDVEPFPTGLAFTGYSLYLTHLYTGRVTEINLTALTLTRVLDTAPQANLSQALVLAPDGQRAYLPQTLSNASNPDLTYDTTVFPIVSVLDLSPDAEAPSMAGGRYLNLATLDRPVNLPYALALSPDGNTLYVANAGSDDVSVIDLITNQTLAHLSVGHNPRGLALDASHLYVLNALDGTLSVFDSLTYLHTYTLTLTTLPLSPQLLLGQRLFNSSLGPLSQDHWLSCASCHFDGGADARTWLGFPDGPRDTPALFGVAGTPPFHWSGDLDELQDVERTIRIIQGGAGLVPGQMVDSLGEPYATRFPELDALAAYLASLEVPLSPFTAPDGTLTESAVRGEHAFRRWGCAICHAPPQFTNYQLRPSDIGDLSLEHNAHGRGLSMDTPSLLGVWATAPYFHDGSAATLRDTFFAKGFHSMGFAMGTGEANDLVEFLKSLPYHPEK